MGQVHIYHCVESLLFTLLCKCLGTEVTVTVLLGKEYCPIAFLRLILWSYTFVINSVCCLVLSCWNMQALSWKKPSSGWGGCCFSTFWDVQAAKLIGTYAPTYHQRSRLLNWTLITTHGSFHYYVFLKKFKFQFVWPQNSFPLSRHALLGQTSFKMVLLTSCHVPYQILFFLWLGWKC